AGGSGSAEERADAAADKLDLRAGDPWEDRQAEQLLGERLGDGEGAGPVPELSEGAREMRGHRVVAGGPDPVRGEEGRELLAPGGADDGEGPDGRAAPTKPRPAAGAGAPQPPPGPRRGPRPHRT